MEDDQQSDDCWDVSNFIEYRQLKDVSPQTVIRQGRACEKCAVKGKPGCYCFLTKELFTHILESKYWSPVAKEAEELYNVKCLLSNYNISEWSQHTDTTFPASKVKPIIRSMPAGDQDMTPPELLTNAWLKFYEILKKLELIDLSARSVVKEGLKTFHLCECPGAFVTATNHYLKTACGDTHVDWDWKALSLDTYHECNDWFDMLDNDLFYKETYGYWIRGNEGTGNILKAKNVTFILNFLHSKKWQANLVTADGSFDTQHDAGNQEELVFPLLLAETLVAMGSLAMGGHFVLKAYSLLTPCSIGLLALIANAFQSVHLVKPFVSKPGNSEIYVVAKGFAGVSQTIFTACRDLIERPVKHPGAVLIPDHYLSPMFVKEMTNHVSALAQRQTENIQQNIESFLAHENPFATAKDTLAEQWISSMDIKWIKRDQRIVPSTFLGDGTLDGNDLHMQNKGKTKPTHAQRNSERVEWSRLLEARLAIFLKKQEGDSLRAGWVYYKEVRGGITSMDLASICSEMKTAKRVSEPLTWSPEDGPEIKTLTHKVVEFITISVSQEVRRLARYGPWCEILPLLKPYRVVSSPYFSQDLLRTLLKTRMACPPIFLPVSYGDVGTCLRREKDIVSPYSIDSALLLLTRSKPAATRVCWLEISFASLITEDVFNTPLSLPLRSSSSNSGFILDATSARDSGQPRVLEPPTPTHPRVSRVKCIKNALVNLDLTSKLLADELQHTNELPIIIFIDVVNPSTIHREICQNEIEDQRRLMKSLRIALKFLQDKGDLIISFSSTLTRFTGSLLLLLSTVFRDISMWRPPSVAAWTQRRYLYCRQLDRTSQCKSPQFKLKIDLIRACINKCLLDLEKRKDLLSSLHYVLPPVLFAAKPFVEWLTAVNDSLAIEELTSLQSLHEACSFLCGAAEDKSVRTVSLDFYKMFLSHESVGGQELEFVEGGVVLPMNLFVEAIKAVVVKKYKHLTGKLMNLFCLHDLLQGHFETTRAWLEKARPRWSVDYIELSHLPLQSIGFIQGSLENFKDVDQAFQTTLQLVVDPVYQKWGFDFLDDLSKDDYAMEREYFFDTQCVAGGVTATTAKLMEVRAHEKHLKSQAITLGHRLHALVSSVMQAQGMGE
eukprot:Blabericola_migrator_1__2712@NODE_1771_length_3818_cov_18_925620_g1143_i0_p1_GENE_NODE_1771_length_3818_cov_18_925620_g1143_i0NODE_1771_length_3818_cov_18_925620_g1143_i0_p1_ORF_typecomplete_len1121_score269_89FtsJ/PF01728_19/8_5e21FtsJ/PF01728_19/8_1e05Methyltrans_Mon/PF14314_6/7_9e05Methyltrans_Mon/PF14314_6/12Reovirus_L2/PF06016_11/0_047LIP1/PF15904_5/9e03LIP1/PF15904_5/0_28LIP1/PF15904_5/7_7e03_NODE_1771_length_3818_cov_18_925620_g1143_i0143376